MTTRPFTVDPVLTAIAVNFTNPDVAFIADSVLPRVAVGGQTYTYDYYPPAEAFTVPDTTVGRRGMVPEVEFSAEKRTGMVLDRGLDASIPQTDIESAQAQRAAGNSAYDPEARAVEGLTHLVRLDRERRVAGIVGDANNYEADKRLTLAGADKWSDPTSDPISDILSAMDATFIARPNVASMGRAVFTVLRNHPKILKAVHGNDGDSGVATAAQIAALFDLQELLIGDSFANTARPGQPAAMARLWGNFFALTHRSSVASGDNGLPQFGMTAEWRVSGSAMVSGRFSNPKSPGLLGGQTIRVGEFVEEHLVAPETGYLISAPV